MTELTDRHHRNMTYLRLSVTDRCNLRCAYCVPRTPFTMLSHNDILKYEEMLRIVRAGVHLGIRKVRVTGGEPLVRKGICGFLKQLHEIEGLKDISITTNGVLLREHLDGLKSAGIQRLNISLDTMERDCFQALTKRDYFDKVWQGIHLALDKGFDPIKINVVVMRGVNDHELSDFAELSIQYPFHIRFIEYMPIGNSAVDVNMQMLTPEIRQRIQPLGELIAVARHENDGPAFRYRFENARGEIGFISPISRHFCSQCNRLRLTANGMIRTCLLSNHQIDIKTPLRNGCSDETLYQILLESVKHKKQDHGIGVSEKGDISTRMSAIGG